MYTRAMVGSLDANPDASGGMSEGIIAVAPVYMDYRGCGRWQLSVRSAGWVLARLCCDAGETSAVCSWSTGATSTNRILRRAQVGFAQCKVASLC